MAVGARDERRKTRLAWAEALETNEPIIVPGTSGAVDAQSLSQHIYASPPTSTEAGTEAHAIADNTPIENGVEA